MAEKTTIQVSIDIRDLLEAKKMGNESLNDVLRREFGQDVNDEVQDLTAFLAPEQTQQVEALLDLLADEFDFNRQYIPAADSDRSGAVIQLQHPETDMPLVELETHESGSYAILIRGQDRKLFRWKGESTDFERIDEYDISELRRLVNGAYEQQSS